MLAVAAVPVMVTEAVFGPDNSTGGWERLAYVFPFAYGFLIASDARFESALARVRWPAVAVAAAATAGLLGWAAAAPGVVTGAALGWSAPQGLAGWAWVAAIAGFAAAFTARRHQTGTGTPPPAPARQPRWQRAAGYANQAVLPFYLLHEPVIVAFGWIIVRWHAPILVSTWLNAGVNAPQVAERAGNSVPVLVYAKCLTDSEQSALKRIEQALLSRRPWRQVGGERWPAAPPISHRMAAGNLSRWPGGLFG